MYIKSGSYKYLNKIFLSILTFTKTNSMAGRQHDEAPDYMSDDDEENKVEEK